MSPRQSASTRARVVRNRAAAKATAEQLLAAAARAHRRRRDLATATVAVVLVVAAFTALVMSTPQGLTPKAALIDALCSSVVLGGLAAQRFLGPRLGSLTTTAALAGVAGLLFAALAALSSSCPDSSSTAPCTPSEVGTWGLNGVLVVLALFVFLGVPLRAARAVRGLVRVLRRVGRDLGDRVRR